MQNYQNDVTATNDCNENEIAINTSGTKGTIPQDLRTGFNLGAFCLPLLWGIFNGSYKSALIPFLSYILTYMMTFIPVVGLIGIFVNFCIRIGFAMCGNAWAWQGKRWSSVESFKSSQRIWDIVATILLLLYIIIGIVGGVATLTK